MISKSIERFFIEEKAAGNKDYYGKIHEVNTPYTLKIGDRLYMMKYENRGYAYYNLRILDIKEKGLIVKDRFNIYFLNWKDEDDNKLEFYPFYVFKNGINYKNFFDKVTKCRSDFYQYGYRDFILNFKNIMKTEFKENARQTSFLNIV